MDTYAVIRTKRDRRAFSDRPLADATLRRILQAGRMAGSAKYAQPCRFIVMRDRARIAALARCGDFAVHLSAAPVVVVVVLLPAGDQYDPLRALPFDAGRAAQNMMLTAWAEGVVSCPTTMHRPEDAAAVLRLPAGHRVATVLPFGYPAADGAPATPRPRLPLSEFIYAEEWGQRPMDNTSVG